MHIQTHRDRDPLHTPHAHILHRHKHQYTNTHRDKSRPTQTHPTQGDPQSSAQSLFPTHMHTQRPKHTQSPMGAPDTVTALT